MVATLGSCVSVCLFDPRRGIGGMNHIFQNVSSEPYGDAGVIAEVERLINALMHLGVPRDHLAARVAGGAQVLLKGRRHGLAIAQACLTFLERERVPILGISIGGQRARRVRFHPATGRLLVATFAYTGQADPPLPKAPRNGPEMF